MFALSAMVSTTTKRQEAHEKSLAASLSTRTVRVTALSASPAKSSAIPCINSPKITSVMVKQSLIGMRRIAGKGWIVQQGMDGPVHCLRRSPSRSLTLVLTSADPRRIVQHRRVFEFLGGAGSPEAEEYAWKRFAIDAVGKGWYCPYQQRWKDISEKVRKNRAAKHKAKDERLKKEHQIAHTLREEDKLK